MEMLMDSSQAEHSLLSSVTASERTLNPYVTGTSVVAIKYKDGILMAADMGVLQQIKAIVEVYHAKIAKITEEGVTISQPYSLKTFWGYSAFQNPTVGAEGSWLDMVTGWAVTTME
ncbi:proteasome subunit beta type-4 [Quercus suber]|uniref:Proteasome subunit beta type-4 n=1 Tax=Quercus suber TaxID=58331 RepID=A0AAW0IXP6_QUESU